MKSTVTGTAAVVGIAAAVFIAGTLLVNKTRLGSWLGSVTTKAGA